MADLIDRQAAIKCIEKRFCDECDQYNELNCIDNLLELPTIEPEVKHGLWVETKETVWTAKEIDGGKQTEIAIVSAKCSVCQKWADEVNTFPPRMHYKYCPNCNAIMDGGTENV